MEHNNNSLQQHQQYRHEQQQSSAFPALPPLPAAVSSSNAAAYPPQTYQQQQQHAAGNTSAVGSMADAASAAVAAVAAAEAAAAGRHHPNDDDEGGGAGGGDEYEEIREQVSKYKSKLDPHMMRRCGVKVESPSDYIVLLDDESEKRVGFHSFPSPLPIVTTTSTRHLYDGLIDGSLLLLWRLGASCRLPLALSLFSRFPSFALLPTQTHSLISLFYFIIIASQDRFLPIANISRIMKNLLPENAKIAKDSKEAVQETVSEFISFITSEASDKCLQEKRKTINGDDLLWAMSTLGFDKYVEPLKIYLNKYREAVRGDKPLKQQAGQGQGQGGGGQGGRPRGEGGSGGGANPIGRPSARASLAGEGIGVPPNKKPKFANEEEGGK